MEEFIQLLKKLSEARGPSGFEDEVREVVIKEMEPFVDEVLVDRWGNVIGVKRGASDYRAMVAAHIDEIGLIIDHIDKEGFLRFRPIGGWNEVTLVGQRVWVRTSEGRWIRGVIGSAPPFYSPGVPGGTGPVRALLIARTGGATPGGLLAPSADCWNPPSACL